MPRRRKFNKRASPVIPQYGRPYQESLSDVPGIVAFAFPDKNDAANTRKKIVVVTAPKSVPIVEFCSEIEEKDQPDREKEKNAEIVSLAVLKKLGFKTNTANSQVDVIQPSKDIPRATEVIFIGRDGVRYVYSGASSPDSLRDLQFEAFLLSIAQSQSQVEMFYKYYSQTFLFALRFFVSREVTENLPDDVETQGRIMQIFSQYFSADNTENRAIIDFSNPEKIMVQSEVLNCYSNAEQELEPSSVLTLKLEVSQNGVEFIECGASALPKAILTEGVAVLSNEQRVAELLQQDFVQDEMLRLEPIDEQESQQIPESQFTDESTERPDIHKYPDPPMLAFTFPSKLRALARGEEDEKIIAELLHPTFKIKINGILKNSLLEAFKEWLLERVSKDKLYWTYYADEYKKLNNSSKINKPLFKKFLDEEKINLDIFVANYRRIDISAFVTQIKRNLSYLNAEISTYHECVYEFDHETQQLKFQVRLAIAITKDGIRKEIPGIVCINGVLAPDGQVSETNIGYTNQFLRKIVEDRNFRFNFENFDKEQKIHSPCYKYKLTQNKNKSVTRSLNDYQLDLRIPGLTPTEKGAVLYSKGANCIPKQQITEISDIASSLFDAWYGDFNRGLVSFAIPINRETPGAGFYEFMEYLGNQDDYRNYFDFDLSNIASFDWRQVGALKNPDNDRAKKYLAKKFFNWISNEIGIRGDRLLVFIQAHNQYISHPLKITSQNAFRKTERYSLIQLDDNAKCIIDPDTFKFQVTGIQVSAEKVGSQPKLVGSFIIKGEITNDGAEIVEIQTSTKTLARLFTDKGTVDFDALEPGIELAEDQKVENLVEYAPSAKDIKINYILAPLNSLLNVNAISSKVRSVLADEPRIDISKLITLRSEIISAIGEASATNKQKMEFTLNCFDQFVTYALIDRNLIHGFANLSDDNLMKLSPYAFAIVNQAYFDSVSRRKEFWSLNAEQHGKILKILYNDNLAVKLFYVKNKDKLPREISDKPENFFSYYTPNLILRDENLPNQVSDNNIYLSVITEDEQQNLVYETKLLTGDIVKIKVTREDLSAGDFANIVSKVQERNLGHISPQASQSLLNIISNKGHTPYDKADAVKSFEALSKICADNKKNLTKENLQYAQRMFFGDELIRIRHNNSWSPFEKFQYDKLKQRNLKHALTYPIELLQKIYNANKDLSFEWVKTSLLYQKLEKASFIEITQKWQRPSIQKLFRLDKSLAIDLMKSNLDAAIFFMKNKKAREQIGLKNNDFQKLYANHNQNRVFINLLMEEKLYKGWLNEAKVEQKHLVKSGPFGLSKKVIPAGTFDSKMFAHLIRTQKFKEIPQIINLIACIRDSDNQVLTILFRALADGQADHLNQDSQFFCGIVKATTNYLNGYLEPSEEQKPAVLRIAAGMRNNYEMASAVADYFENQFYATSDETQKERLLNSLVDLACIDRTGKIAEKMLETGFFRQLRGKHVSNHLTKDHLVKLLNAHSENERVVNAIVKEKLYTGKIKSYEDLNSQRVIELLQKAKGQQIKREGKFKEAHFRGQEPIIKVNRALYRDVSKSTQYQHLFDAFVIFQATEGKTPKVDAKYKTYNSDKEAFLSLEVTIDLLKKLVENFDFDNKNETKQLFNNFANSNFTLLEFIAKHQLFPIEKLSAMLANPELSSLVQLNYPITKDEAKKLMNFWVQSPEQRPTEPLISGTPFESIARKARIHKVMVERAPVSAQHLEEEVELVYNEPKYQSDSESSEESFDYDDILENLEEAEPKHILAALNFAITQRSHDGIQTILASKQVIKLFNLYDPNQSTNQLVTIIKAINCIFPNDFLEKIGAEKIKCIFDDTNNAEDFYELCLSKSIASFFMNHHEDIDKMYNFVPRIVADNENSILEWRAFIESFAADQNADENLDARTQIARKLTLSFPNIPEEFRTKLESEETYRATIPSK